MYVILFPILFQAERHPEKLWVQKSNNHRGIKITPVSGQVPCLASPCFMWNVVQMYNWFCSMNLKCKHLLKFFFYRDQRTAVTTAINRNSPLLLFAGLDLSRPKTFVQQYVDKPLLIDERKFDIGIYTIVTSLDPLRIYVVDHEFLLRLV